MRRAIRRARSGLLLTMAVVVVVYSLLPFYVMLTVSITPEQTSFGREVVLAPSVLTLDNYVNLFQALPFARYFRNSVIVAIATTTLALVAAVPAAYSFARYRFRGRRPLLLGLLLLYMIPAVVLIVPLLIIFTRLGLYNTTLGLVVADASLALPFAVWILVGFFATLPRELDEAALIDGCGPLGVLWRVVIPLAVPGIVAVGLIMFIVVWNEFLFAFTFASGEEVKTLPVAMRPFVRGEAGVFWGTIMASATLTSVPVVALALFFQRYLIAGLASGGVKG